MTNSRAISGLPITTVLLTALATGPAFADENSPSQELDPIVVTANLGPETVGESLSSVTVLDAQEVERQNTQEFKDLLRGQPGIDLTSNGSFGKNTSVYTRGTTSESTIFLVDGVRLRSATSGGAPWQYFPLKLAERVEIVRGPRSTLYGADAVGGVIQAFTPDPAGTEPAGWV
jgi:vitamin B12 transporter